MIRPLKIFTKLFDMRRTNFSQERQAADDRRKDSQIGNAQQSLEIPEGIDFEIDTVPKACSFFENCGLKDDIIYD